MLDTIQFPIDSLVITVKVALHDYKLEAHEDIVDKAYETFREYLTHFKYEILASSGGYHYKGKNEKAHAHIHFVTNANAVKTPNPTNKSKQRSDWLTQFRKQGGINPIDYTFESCETQYKDLEKDKAHYNVLSYPLKEGNRVSRFIYRYNGETMDDEMLDALEQYAIAVYNGEQAVQERRQKSEDRSLARKNEILKCARENRQYFDNFREMLYVLDAKYIANLSFSEKPRPSDYKVACQIVAVELGLLLYSDYCLGGGF